MGAYYSERTAYNQTSFWSDPLKADISPMDLQCRTSTHAPYRYAQQPSSPPMTSYNQVQSPAYQHMPYSNSIWASNIGQTPDNLLSYHAQPTKQLAQFLCLHEPCASNLVGFARKADLERHTTVRHNREQLSLTDCEYPGCRRRGPLGFSRKDKMIDHMREVHKVPIPKRSSSKNSPGGS